MKKQIARKTPRAEYFKVLKGTCAEKDKVAQLTVVNNEVVCSISDGTAPLGIFTGGKIQKRKDGNYVPVSLFRSVRKTSKYDITASYPVNANLFVNASGLLSTIQESACHPAVAIVLHPPTNLVGQLQYLWL